MTLALLLLGALLMIIAALGIVRMPDLLQRLSAATKASTLGVGVFAVAAAVHFGAASVGLRGAALLVFVALTAPVAAHLLGRAGYLSGAKLSEGTKVDEYRARSRREDP